MMRNLVLVLGDQLSLTSVAFEGFDAARDRVWMAEVPHESKHVPSTKVRTALFLSAMRHFAEAVTGRAMALDYLKLGTHPFDLIDAALSDALLRHRPESVVMVEAGEWRVEQLIAKACASVGVRLVVRDDLHFMASRAEFADFVRGKQRLVMEAFYRHMRTKHQVLIDAHGSPKAGAGISMTRTAPPSVGKGRAWCLRRPRSSSMRSRARRWPTSKRISAITTARRRPSTGQ